MGHRPLSRLLTPSVFSQGPALDGTAGLPQAFSPARDLWGCIPFTESEVVVVAWPYHSGTFPSLVSSVLSSPTVALAGPSFLPLPSAKCPLSLLYPLPPSQQPPLPQTLASRSLGPQEQMLPGGVSLTPPPTLPLPDFPPITPLAPTPQL